MARTPANVGNHGRWFLNCLSPRLLRVSALVYTVFAAFSAHKNAEFMLNRPGSGADREFRKL